MLVLFETTAGYAVLKFLGDKKLLTKPDLSSEFNSAETLSKIIKLRSFDKFLDTTEALAAFTDTKDGKVSESLNRVLSSFTPEERKQELFVSHPDLGSAIHNKFHIKCVSNSDVQKLMKCIRERCDDLIGVISKTDLKTTNLALAHAYCRQKLHVTPERVDIMMVQSVKTLDNLSKEISEYVERCRECYKVHFPELETIVTDDLTYVKTVNLIGSKERAAEKDLSEILPEDLQEEVITAAIISSGVEIMDEDVDILRMLCDQILDMAHYHSQLLEYIEVRMQELAPNVVALTGFLLAARFVAHAGSLLNLAKLPGSTIQILGAEKRLFKALKSKKNTPKYGLIYQAPLVQKSSLPNKGKMAKKLAAKIACACRVDALREKNDLDVGLEHLIMLEDIHRILEEGRIRKISGAGRMKARFEKYSGVSEVHYNNASAAVLHPSKRLKKK